MPEPRLRDLQLWLRELLVAEKKDPRLERAVLDPSGLEVYARAYVTRLLEALAADFPATRRALGEDTFARMGEAYLMANPPRSQALARVGEALPSFLREHGADPVAALASLEWLLIRAHLAPETERVAVPVASEWGIEAFWRGRSAKIPQSPEHLLVTRDSGLAATVERLEPAQYALLSALQAGRTLEQACALVGESAAPEELERWFADWARRGLVTS